LKVDIVTGQEAGDNGALPGHRGIRRRTIRPGPPDSQFHSKDGGSRVVQNVGIQPHYYTASQPTRL